MTMTPHTITKPSTTTCSIHLCLLVLLVMTSVQGATTTTTTTIITKGMLVTSTDPIIALNKKKSSFHRRRVLPETSSTGTVSGQPAVTRAVVCLTDADCGTGETQGICVNATKICQCKAGYTTVVLRVVDGYNMNNILTIKEKESCGYKQIMKGDWYVLSFLFVGIPRCCMSRGNGCACCIGILQVLCLGGFFIWVIVRRKKLLSDLNHQYN